jgi:hypothetical protein
MSELRTKIAAGATILALGGLGGLALSHPQTPPRATQASSITKQKGKQATVPAVITNGRESETETADD